MKQLYLVRHAKSSWKYPHLRDHDRPLNSRGKRDAPEMGRRLKTLGVLPSLLMASSSTRTIITAEVIANAIGFKTSEIISNEDLFHADTTLIAETVRKLDDQIASAMLFGHNPGLTWFANETGLLKINNIPTCGVVAFSLPIDSWKEFESGIGQLLFYDYPKNKKQVS